LARLACHQAQCYDKDRPVYLGRDLCRVCRDFLNDPKNVRVKNNTVWLSRIFEWYREDFTGENNSPEALIDYLLGYAVEPLEASAANSAEEKMALEVCSVRLGNQRPCRSVQPTLNQRLTKG